MPDVATKEDLAVIFSEDEVRFGGKEYKIKPWTLKQLIAIWPLLSVLIDSIRASFKEVPNVMTLEGFVAILTENPQAVLQILLPHIPTFFSLSISGLSEEDAGEIDLGVASVVLLKIISKNITHLKNSLSLVMSEMTAIVGAMKPVEATTPTPSLGE
jgi:hypothetical protein